MSATTAGARRRTNRGLPGRVLLAPGPKPPSRTINNHSDVASGQGSSFIDLGDSARLTLMLTPQSRGGFRKQAEETFAAAQRMLTGQSRPMVMTSQTIFLRQSDDRAECERIVAGYYGK